MSSTTQFNVGIDPEEIRLAKVHALVLGVKYQVYVEMALKAFRTSDEVKAKREAWCQMVGLDRDIVTTGPNTAQEVSK